MTLFSGMKRVRARSSPIADASRSIARSADAPRSARARLPYILRQHRLDEHRAHAAGARRAPPRARSSSPRRKRSGRGRSGASWVSPPLRNLYLSLVLRPPLRRAADGAADQPGGRRRPSAETVREWVARAAIKWPNDVLIDGRKVAGILTEMDSRRTTACTSSILGIGVNLNATLDDFPAELRDKATSLRLATGSSVDRARVHRALAGTISKSATTHSLPRRLRSDPAVWEASVVLDRPHGGDRRAPASVCTGGCSTSTTTARCGCATPRGTNRAWWPAT